MSHRAIEIATATIAAASLALTVGLVVYAAWPRNPGAIENGVRSLFLLVVLVWAASPYGYFLFSGRSSSEGPGLPASSGHHWAKLVLAGVIGGFGGFLLVDAFILHPDPQSGMVILGVPFYQWAAIGVFHATSNALTKRDSP